jgi:hypothetical protein
MTELEEFRLEVGARYNEWLEKTENRNTSYGELAYIESLNEKQLNEIYEELLNELEED